MEEPREIGEWIQISTLGAGAFGKVMLWQNKNTEESIGNEKMK